MDSNSHLLIVYLLLFLGVFLVYRTLILKKEQKTRLLLKDQVDPSAQIPTSLHPVIDPAKCIGCSACAEACPEQNVLGIINGRAQLVTPSNCIGHGACKTACPVDAISLVFGTEKRGVDIPLLNPNFETSVPGVFIAGELGGMGLIRNAVNQGQQAMDAIAKRLAQKGKIAGVHDVVIIGSGPAGFSASLAAIEKKLDYVVLEQEAFGGTVAHYPRGKIIMTQAMNFPILGKTNFSEISKEELMRFWQDSAQKTGIKINYSECAEKITVEGNVINIKTSKAVHKTQNVLLAIGRRGTPRKLDVPGENKSKVVYRLSDPQQYAGQHVLVVGGGDSALEAALSIAEYPNTTVILSYRSEAFSRVKPKNKERIDNAQAKGLINVLLNSTVVEIFDTEVIIAQKEQKMQFKNDAVIVCAGGVLPTAFLKEIGVQVETKFGTA